MRAPIPRYDFDATKYGGELLVDVGAVDRLVGYVRDGTPHVLAFHEVLLVEEGDGVLFLDGRALPVRPGVVLCTAPGQVRRWATHGTLRGRALFFPPSFPAEFLLDGAFLERLRLFRPGSEALQLDAETAALVAATLARAEATLQRERTGAAAILRATAYHLLTTVETAGDPLAPAGEPVAAAGDARVRRFHALVEAHFRRWHGVRPYADALAVTPDHLSDLVRTATGTSAGAVIRARLVLEARRLLAHTELTVAQVATTLGYDDAAYFGRIFTRATGLAPGRWRAAMRVGDVRIGEAPASPDTTHR